MRPNRALDELPLSPADEDLVRRDSALPGLAILLSPTGLLERLRLAYPGADLRVVTPTYVRYKPGTSCIAGFRLDVGGATVDAYARAHTPSETEKLRKLARAATAALPPRPFGTPTLDLGCATVLSFFPNDTALPAVSAVTSPTALAAVLGEALANIAGRPSAGDIAAAHVTRLAYKPERRFVGRLELAGQPAAVLKFHTKTGYEVAQRNAKMVKSRGPLRVPRRLGRSETHRVVALEWLPGRPLSAVLADAEGQPDWDVITRLGTGLASWAAKGSRRFRHRAGGTAAVIVAVQEVARSVGYLWPPLATRAAALADRVAGRLADQRSRERPTHGDFYAKQVLLDRGELAVVDWDEAGLGDPASDVGNFIAHLELHALAGRLRPERVEPAADALRAGFESAAGRSIAKHLPAHAAAQLLRMAMHPFRSREPDWPGRTAAILARVEELLSARPATATRSVAPPPPAATTVARSARRTAVRVSDPFGVPADPGIPFAGDALNPTTVQDLLARALAAEGLPPGLELRGIRVVRHKPGRRFVVEYALSGAQPDRSTVTIVGKARAKGVDRRTHELVQALSSSGFGPASCDGVSVPQPLGMIPQLGMTLQLKVAGEPATRVLSRGGAAGVALAARLADVAGKLHRAGIPTTRTHTASDELRILRERLGLVAAGHTAWAGRIERLSDACQELMTSVQRLPLAGIHRDFYPDQVLVDGARLYLLDLDLYCRGDPALDVGNCIAHMTELSLRTAGDADAWSDRARAMEDRFLEQNEVTPRASVRAYAAVSLARHVHISTLFADRRHLFTDLLELSLRRVTDAGLAS